MKQFLLSLYKKAVSKYGSIKVIGIGALGLLVLISIISTGISNNIQKSKFDNLISTAEEKLDAGLYPEAQKLVTEALETYPTGDAVTTALEKKISESQISKESFDLALVAIQDKKYIDAIRALNRVLRSSETLYEQAQEKSAEIEPLAIEAALKSAKGLASQRKYIDALTVVVQAKTVAGSTPALEEARTLYEKAAALEKERARSIALSSMKKTKDDFTGVTWYQDRSSPNYINSNGFYLYFGAKGNSSQNLRLVVRYFDDDWLFVKSARISVDGEVFDLGFSSWERDNNSSIWEWIDEPLADRAMIEAIIKSKKAVIRFDGDKYYDTRTVSPTQKNALKNVLYAYDNF